MLFSKSSLLRGLALAAAVVVSNSAFGQVASGSGDVSAHIGFNSLKGIDNNKHVQFGFAGGVNVSKNVALVAEYAYLPQGSIKLSGIQADASYQNIGAALRYSFITRTRVVPYAVAAGGYSRVAAGASYLGYSASDSANGGYVALGGGASIYAAPSWGVRPEVRWDRQAWSYQGESGHRNDARVMVAVFYQFGGRK